jgi:toxin secretion/phage lysis holin
MVFRYACVLTLQAIDIASGFLKCKRRRIKMSSAKMATGIYKKMGFLLCLVVADILTVVSVHYNMGFTLTIPVFMYLIATESLSIYENTNDTKIVQIIQNVIKEWSK